VKKKQMIETATVCGKTITIDVAALVSSESMYFNATEIAAQFGKLIRDFLDLKSTKEYIYKYSELFNSGSQPDLEMVITKKGKYGGTWLHQEVALEFARWVSVDFRVKLDQWIKNRIKEEQSKSADRQDARLEWPDMTAAITAAHDDPKFYHYSNEADLINRVALGMTSKKFKEMMNCKNVRDALTGGQIKKIKKMQRLNTSMIELNMETKQRKEILLKMFPSEKLVNRND